MNRHERRAQRAAERKTRRKPEREMPPEYYEAIETAAKACIDWIQAHPDAELKWHPPAQDGVLMIAALCAGAKYLADSPDAFRMLADVDAATGRELTIYQMAWALRRIRAMPMPDGSYYGTKTTHESVVESEGYRMFRAYGEGTGRTTRIQDSPCPFCGLVMGGASAGTEAVPEPGCPTVCVACGGISCFAEDLSVRRMTEAEWADLHPETRQQAEDASALFRLATTSRGNPTRGDA